MLRRPEDILNKPISQHLLDQILLDLALAPAHRLLILVQTHPTNDLFEKERKETVSVGGIRYYLSKIWRQEGLLGFWKGCVFEMARSCISRLFHSAFLHLYEPLLHVDDPSRSNLKTLVSDALIFLAVDFSLQFLQHPYKVIRVRASAIERPDDPNAIRGFRKISDCVERIWREDGFRGFYRGFTVSLFESLTNVAYLSLARVIAHHFISDEDTSLWGDVKGIVSNPGAGSIASAALNLVSVGRNLKKRIKTIIFQLGRSLANLLILYPFRVVQKKVIMHESGWRTHRASKRSIVKELWRKEGIYGFYSGLTMQILLNTTSVAVAPVVASISGAILPSVLKDVPKIGELSDAVADTVGEIKEVVAETTVEQVGKIKEIAENIQDKVQASK